MKKLKMATLVTVMMALLLAVSPLAAAASAGTASAPRVATTAFDPGAFGRILSEEEIDAVDGEALWIGMAISAGVYLVTSDIDTSDWTWWAGLAGATLLGAVPFTGGAAAAGSSVGMAVYGTVSSAVVGELMSTAYQSAIDSY